MVPRHRGSCLAGPSCGCIFAPLADKNDDPDSGVTDATHLVLHVRQHFRHNGWTPRRQMKRTNRTTPTGPEYLAGTRRQAGHKNRGHDIARTLTEAAEGTHRQDRAMRTGTSPPNKSSDKNERNGVRTNHE